MFLSETHPMLACRFRRLGGSTEGVTCKAILSGCVLSVLSLDVLF